MNGNGETLIVGGNYGNIATGYAKVFDYDASNSIWEQRGADILASTINEGFGRSADIDSLGNRIVVGAIASGLAGYNAGKADVFQWDTTGWLSINNSVLGATTQDYFSTALAISADGTRFIAGSPAHFTGTTTSGKAEVFSNASISSQLSIEANHEVIYHIYPNPIIDVVNLELNHLEDVEINIYSINGQLVYQANHHQANSFQIELNEKPGVYIIEVKAVGVMKRYKIIKA